MSSNLQLLLLSIVGLVVLATFIISMKVRQKHHKMQPAKLDKDVVAEIFEDDFELISTPASKNAILNKQDSNQAYTATNFSEPDVVSEAKIQPQAQSSKLDTDQKQSSGSAQQRNNGGIIVMHVIAKPDAKFVGYELLQALLAAGLRFGDMSIFHRHQQANGQGIKLFSLASATEPGIFDMNKMGAFSCRGLSLFMQLTLAEHNQKAFDLMLTAAQQLADDLDGILLDEQRQPMTQEKVNQNRELVDQHLEKFQ